MIKNLIIIFMQWFFSVSKVTEKSPFEYWFIKTKAGVFVHKNDGLSKAWLNLNEIRSVIKLGNLIKEKVLERWPRKFLQ